MKRYIFNSVCFIFLFVGFSHCEQTAPTPVLLALDTSFVEQSNEFAFNFLKTLDQEETGKNYFVSPLSLNVALGMLLNGADNSSKDEILKTLNLEGLSMELINKNYLELIEKLPNIDPNVTNIMANSMWQREGFAVEENYKGVLKSFFSADLYEEDFTETTLSKINQWASDHTNAKIKEVLTEISPDHVMFLLNALYFKGDWALKFDKKNTNKKLFNGTSSSNLVDMMSKLDTFAFAELNGFKALDMPYGSGQYQMRVLLPEEGQMEEMMKNLSISEWKLMSEAMRTQKVELSFPKFSMEYSKKLNDVLSIMGMPTLFTSGADLSKISPPAGKIQVSFVKQDTFIAVDEEGSEAAAVTTIGIELTAMPNYPLFDCNRPFVYFIYEKSSGTIQFVGKVMDL